MADAKKVIECPCGVVLEGEGDPEVVNKARTHAREVHEMDLTEEQALSMARPA